jgi:hypothetical protein
VLVLVLVLVLLLAIVIERASVEELLVAIEKVLRSVGCETTRLNAESARLVDEICADATLLE